jgi:hypothetical protein
MIPLSSTDKGNTDKLDAAGHSVLQLIGKAAGIAEEHTQHVLKAADQVAHELHAARDRIAELEEELLAHRDRADRAEQWLNKIRQEIDQQFVQRQTKTVHDAPYLKS